jgi:hypothetical protein
MRPLPSCGPYIDLCTSIFYSTSKWSVHGDSGRALHVAGDDPPTMRHAHESCRRPAAARLASVSIIVLQFRVRRKISQKKDASPTNARAADAKNPRRGAGSVARRTDETVERRRCPGSVRHRPRREKAQTRGAPFSESRISRSSSTSSGVAAGAVSEGLRRLLMNLTIMKMMNARMMKLISTVMNEP